MFKSTTYNLIVRYSLLCARHLLVSMFKTQTSLYVKMARTLCNVCAIMQYILIVCYVMNLG